MGSAARLPAICCFLQLAGARGGEKTARGQGSCLCQGCFLRPLLELERGKEGGKRLTHSFKGHCDGGGERGLFFRLLYTLINPGRPVAYEGYFSIILSLSVIYLRVNSRNVSLPGTISIIDYIISTLPFYRCFSSCKIGKH